MKTKTYYLVARLLGLTPEELDSHYERIIRAELEGSGLSEKERLLTERIAGMMVMAAAIAKSPGNR